MMEREELAETAKLSFPDYEQPKSTIPELMIRILCCPATMSWQTKIGRTIAKIDWTCGR